MGRPARLLQLALPLVLSCGEPGDTGSTSELPPAQVEITATQGARLCAGTSAWARAEFARVVEATGMPPLFAMPVVVGHDAVRQRCTNLGDPRAVLGCTVGDGGSVRVFTTADALAHELVHALRRQQDLRTIALFEEGFAELVDGSDPYPRWNELDPARLPEVWLPPRLAQLPRLDDGDTYRVAAHFFGALTDEHGPDSVAAFMRGGIDDTPEQALERFELHFGPSLEGQSTVWSEAGPQGFGRGRLCPDGAEPAPTGPVVLQATVDCDDPQTFGLIGAGERAWVRRCVELSAGRYEVELAAGRARWESVPQSCAEDSSALDAAPK
ncbi:MAG: hypothetical protein AB1Z98_13960, partial [Nannocystaceae bacterium]